MANNCCTLKTQEERDRIFALSTANKAMELAQRGLFQAAQTLSTSALSLLEVGGGCENEEGCLIYTRLAFLPYLQGDLQRALPLWQKALELAEKVHGPLHVATAMTRSNLGQMYLELQNVELAEPLITKAWEDLQALPSTEDEAELKWRADITADTRQAVEKLAAAKGAVPEATKIPGPAEATPIL